MRFGITKDKNRMNSRNFSRSLDSDPRIEFFNRQACHWDDDALAIERNCQRLDQLCGLLCLERGMNVLEVGCGTGQITPWLCSAVAPGQVVGIDFSKEMIARALVKGIPVSYTHLTLPTKA